MKKDLEDFIRDNRDQLDTKTPPPEVLGRILAQVQPQEKPKKEGILISFRVIQWAAACIVLVVGVLSFWLLHKKPDNTIAAIHPVVKQLPVKPQADSATKVPEQMVQVRPESSKSVEAVDEDIAARKSALLVRLNEKKSQAEKQVMFAGLSNMESPATRINAASQVSKLKYAGNDVVDALVETLNNDPSANVRLAALDGLSRFYRETYVRKKLIASLKKQQDPLVQIALINLLTRMKESGILSQLENMVHDDNTQKPVKDCAYSGIMLLQSS